MSTLSEAANMLAYIGRNLMKVAEKPGAFQLPRDLGNTPADIVRNASTAKVPLTLYGPNDVAAKHEFLNQLAHDNAEAYIRNVVVPRQAAKGNQMTEGEIQSRIDEAHAHNLASYIGLPRSSHSLSSGYGDLYGNEQNWVIATPHGFGAIATPNLDDPLHTEIAALHLNSEGRPSGGGTNAYQAMLALTKNLGVKNYTSDLTPINAFRKAAQLTSHGLRTGDLSHVAIDPMNYFSAGIMPTPDMAAFNDLPLEAKLGYLAKVGSRSTDFGLIDTGQDGLQERMQGSQLSPYLVPHDYSNMDPVNYGLSGPKHGVGPTSVKQGMLTDSLDNAYFLGARDVDPSKLSDDFTNGLFYAEGGSVQPTEAQAKAGNYKKGHLNLHGMQLSIENPKGSVRSGTDPNGQAWSVQMPAHYGYIRRTEGADGDHVDAYLGDDHASPIAHVIDQVDPHTKQFDEHKVMLGFGSTPEAVNTYVRGFSDGSGHQRLGDVTPVSINDLRDWLKNGDTTKPFVQRLAKGGSVENGPHAGMTHYESYGSDEQAPLAGIGHWLSHTAHRMAHPFDPDVMKETVQNLKDTFDINHPENAVSFVSPLGGMAGVIKQSGGQWLNETVDNALRTLKKPEWLSGGAMNEVQPGSFKEYLDQRDASLGRGDSHQNVNTQNGMHRWFQQTYPGAYNQAVGHNIAVNKWIDGPLRKYIMRDMGSPQDPILQLHEQGISHLADPVYQLNYDISKHGNPAFQHDNQQYTATTDWSKAWEGTADNAISTLSALAHATTMHDYLAGDTPPWLMKLAGNPETYNTPVHSIADPQYALEDLGFGHLTDHLKNQLDTGQLRPEQLNKVSVADAVRGAHQWNQELAAKMADQNAALANNPATHLLKDYGDGMKWVELKAPSSKEDFAAVPYKDLLDEVPMDVNERIQDEAHDAVRADNPGIDDESDDYMAQVTDRTWRGLQEWAANNPQMVSKSLKDALSYEGNQMGHCVGGYCPSVQSGQSRIFSLRDAKGQPHVTIETAPDELDPRFVDDSGIREQLAKQFGPDEEGTQAWNEAYNTLAAQQMSKSPARVVQIKGKQNAAPVEKYLPYVQDFVKTQGPWSGVGDLRNTGLVDFTKGASANLLEHGTGQRQPYTIDPGYYTPTELADHLILQGADPLVAIQHAGAYDHPLLQQVDETGQPMRYNLEDPNLQ